MTLLTRHVDGVRTTSEGEEILAAAREMERASFGLIRARDRTVPALSGEVKLAVTEGLGTSGSHRRLDRVSTRHPKLLVDLNCAMQSADVLRLQADTAVQLAKPANPDVKIVKLGTLHSCHSRAVLYQRLRRTENARRSVKHRIVLQIAEQTAMKEIYDRVAFPGVPQVGFVAMRNNVSSAHYLGDLEGRRHRLCCRPMRTRSAAR